MPIARLTGEAQHTKNVIRVLDAEAGENISVGMAVAVVDVAGTKTIFRCGASTYGLQFVGFADEAASVGDNLNIVTGRGSVVTPMVNGVMAGNDDLFLSSVPGFIEPNPPARGPGVFTRPVGHAISSTEMMLLTDSRFGTVG